MNNKGFTLVELLTAIIILVLLGYLATTTIAGIVKSSKEDLYDTQIELIKTTVETWGSENLDKLPDEGECNYITLNDLTTYGLFEEEVINPKTNKPFPGNMKIKMSSTITKNGKLKTTYEVDSKNVDSCENVYTSICKLIRGEEKEIGSKYECEVKPGTKYNFYVLSKEEDKLNLIMERNICEDGTVATEENTCTVAWMSESDYGCVDNNDNTYCAGHERGPVTAMTHLHNATKDWINIPDMIMAYEDENMGDKTQEKGTTGYGSIKTEGNETTITDKNGNITATYTNLKARLPKYSEMKENGCTSTYGSCPSWLVDYLDSTSYYIEGKTNISGIGTYWTLSSVAGSSSHAWDVVSNGYVGYGPVGYDHGARPVIIVLESDVSK